MTGVELFTAFGTKVTLGQAIGGVAALASAAGALQQGQSQAAQQRFQAQVAERDATIAEQNRVAAIQQGVEDERRLRAQQRFALSRQRAATGQSGIDPSTGTPLLLNEQDETDAMLNVLTQRYQTELRARGYALGRDSATASANAYRMGARQSRMQGYTGAGTALLSGGYRVLGGR
jgi:hypothetical protein